MQHETCDECKMGKGLFYCTRCARQVCGICHAALEINMAKIDPKVANLDPKCETILFKGQWKSILAWNGTVPRY